MSSRNQKVGAWGESVAAEHLERRGYEIVTRNVRTPYGEIDIVATKDGYIVFVEVKTRTSSSLGPPEISVTPRKQEHMLAAAEHYAQEHDIDRWQIDVIAVEGKPGKQPVFTHFENAI
ncbi:MAG: YraN family protein [Anaerolineales bacterium]|jgi:putative endonuclease